MTSENAATWLAVEIKLAKLGHKHPTGLDDAIAAASSFADTKEFRLAIKNLLSQQEITWLARYLKRSARLAD